MKKNWKKIAGVRSFKEMAILIDSSVAEIDSKYLLSEGEENGRLSKKQFFQILNYLKNVRQKRHFCEDIGLMVTTRYFSGSKKGETDGMPYVDGGYSTVSNGWGEHFFTTKKKVGSIMRHAKQNWVVLANKYVKGNAHIFSDYYFFMTPKRMFDKLVTD